MKADCDGVAGFFEDLPVLMFVLTGVFIVVAAGVWTSNTLEAQRIRDGLGALAEGLVNEAFLEVEARLGGESFPTVSALSNLNLSHLAGGVLPAHRCSIAIIERYPEVRWLVHWFDETPDSPIQAVGAAKLLNALDDHLMVVVVEVRAIVW
ncbi:MAG: hypothetical protein NTY62_07670 [Euryarchaeota archaeon]|nr:hypothetical protein [Euryarchaeota archaeon]